MRLEVRVERACADRGAARIADALERIAEGDAVDVALREQVLDGEDAGKRARSAHYRNEAAAFLVGPDRDAHRLAGLDAGGRERAQDLQSREDPEITVELAARGLRVDVAAGQHHRGRRVAAAADREDVAGAVDLDRAAGIAQPPDDAIAALAIELGEREAAHAAPRRRADPQKLHQRAPQSRAVDAQSRRWQRIGSHAMRGGRAAVARLCQRAARCG